MTSHTFTHLISIGMNCETRYQLKQKFGAIDSSLLEWAVVPPTHLVEVLKNPHLIFSGEIEEKRAYNMWHCNVTDITFHGKKTIQELLGEDGKPDEEKIAQEKEDVISRTKYLTDKFIRIAHSEETKLYILAIHPDFCKYTQKELRIFIQNISKTIQKIAVNASLLVITLDANRKFLKGLDNDNNIFIRTVNHFSPYDQATNLDLVDLQSWQEILSEFRLKNVRPDMKIYKFEKMESLNMNKQINKKTPKISVVMSTYNRAGYVKEAIESILNQTYKDFEFIIIDDCSTDNTSEVIQSYVDKDDRIVFIRNEKNMDYNYNLRRGFDLARGEYIARMDDDDISLPTRFEKQVTFLDQHNDITVLGTFIETFGESVLETWVKDTDPDILAILMNFFNPMCHPSVMIRKSFLREHNLNYSPKELYAEEYHLWKEIILHGGKLANLDEVLLRYRCHKKSVTQKRDTSKIQAETAKRVSYSLLGRFFKNKKDIKYVLRQIIPYPFSNNSPKKLESVLTFIKQNDKLNIISEKAYSKFYEKYCGKPCTMEIFFAADNKFSQHLCVAMTSILVNSLSVENFNFYILDGGISDKNKAKINTVKKIKNCNIEFIKVEDNLFKKCPITSSCQHISKQTYYRYIIPLLKPKLDKCFYLDCDIIAKDSMNAFWNINLNDNYIAAVEELYVGSNEDAKRLNLDTVFNAGTMLVNLKKWNDDNITEKLFSNTDILLKEDKIIWVDQDVLNYTFNNKVKFVSPCFNLQCNAFYDGSFSKYTQKEMEFAKSLPAIIHFNSCSKPWNKKCTHPLWKEYYKYLKLSPYKNEYYKYKFKKILTEFGRIFFYKKKSNDKTKIKILGIPVYKKINRDYLIKKYILGIKFYQKKDNFSQMQDRFNYKLDCIEKAVDNSLKEISTRLIQEINKLKHELKNEISKSLAVYTLHQKVFPQFKNINKGKDVVFIATGPTLKDYEPLKDAIHIGVNKAFKFDKIKFDYLIIQDYFGSKNYINDFCQYDAIKFLGIISLIWPKSIIPESLAEKYNISRFYTAHPDELSFPPLDISSSIFWDAYSVVFPAMQFVLWTNPKRIYLVGCDCSEGYFDNAKSSNTCYHMIDGWKKLKEFASTYYPETEIISINPVGLKGLFTDIYTKENKN